MSEIIKVENLEQLKYLYDNWAMTWEGLRKEDFNIALKEAGTKDAKGYVISGKTFNELCKLTGSNKYPNGLNIFAIYPFKGLAMQFGARWMYDIIDNNANRENYHPFKEVEEND